MPVSLVNNFFDMFATNVFRPLPHIKRQFFVSNIEPSVMDRDWPHLSPLYDLLLAYMSVCPKDPRFNLDFEKKMLSQLQAPDGNERDLVAAFFMKYAEANPDREPELWMKMAHLLSLYREGIIGPFVVDPVLQFFAVRFQAAKCSRDDRLKNGIFSHFIVPLVSCRHFLSWTDRITVILERLSARRPEMIARFVKAVLLRWPRGRSSIYVYWINWINTLVAMVPPKDFRCLMRPLFSLYAELGKQQSLRIVEASLRVWSNRSLITRLGENSPVIFPLIFPVLINGEASPDKRIRSVCQIVMKLFQEMNPRLWNGLITKYKNQTGPIGQNGNLAVKASKWAAIARRAAALDRSFPLGMVVSATYRFFGVGE
jgi:hypothetical protein